MTVGIYKRPGSRFYWMRYLDAEGKRCWKSTEQITEADAQEVHDGVLAALRGEREYPALGPLTVRKYSVTWIEERKARGLETVSDDQARLDDHILPVLGSVVLSELRRKQVQEFTRSLRKRISKRTKKPLAPRTQHHVYNVLHQLCRDALADERIAIDPCILKRGDLPKKQDADPTWRSSAVFETREVALLISDAAVPMDRRVYYALHFLSGMRPGEGSAARWRDYEPKVKPLGRITVARAYDRKRSRIKGTKTEQARYLPVHPALAELLADWRDGNWAKMLRRPPTPDDLIIPSRKGAPRGNSLALKRFKEDLARLGLRDRRAYDTRRTFTSLTQADGARRDVVRWLTHPPTEQVDAYTTMPWPTLCEAVACWRIRRLSQAECAALREQLAAEVRDSAETVEPQEEKTVVDPKAYDGREWRGVRDSKLGRPAPAGSPELIDEFDFKWLRARVRARALEAQREAVPAVSGRGGPGGRERAPAVAVRTRRQGTEGGQ